MKTSAKTVVIICILLIVFGAGYSMGQKSYSRNDLADKIREMGHEVKEQYPAVAGILYSLAGTIFIAAKLRKEGRSVRMHQRINCLSGFIGKTNY